VAAVVGEFIPQELVEELEDLAAEAPADHEELEEQVEQLTPAAEAEAVLIMSQVQMEEQAEQALYF